MSDPQRLLSDSSASKSERFLLEAWQEERPAVDGRAKTLAALGIASGAAAIGAASGLGSVAPKALAATTFSIWKWLMLAVLAIGASGAALVALTKAGSAPSPTVAAAPTSLTPGLPFASAVSVPTSSPSDVTLPADPIAAPMTKKPRTATPETSDSLGDEIATIDDARKALDARDFRHAEELAIRYEQRFPHAAFDEEAQTIRIAALAQSGETAKAQALGTNFIQAHPYSSYVPRVRDLIDR